MENIAQRRAGSEPARLLLLYIKRLYNLPRGPGAGRGPTAWRLGAAGVLRAPHAADAHATVLGPSRVVVLLKDVVSM